MQSIWRKPGKTDWNMNLDWLIRSFPPVTLLLSDLLLEFLCCISFHFRLRLTAAQKSQFKRHMKRVLHDRKLHMCTKNIKELRQDPDSAHFSPSALDRLAQGFQLSHPCWCFCIFWWLSASSMNKMTARRWVPFPCPDFNGPCPSGGGLCGHRNNSFIIPGT